MKELRGIGYFYDEAHVDPKYIRKDQNFLDIALERGFPSAKKYFAIYMQLVVILALLDDSDNAAFRRPSSGIAAFRDEEIAMSRM